jgi:regulatory protein YycI of two-component signal transduction system YycFG
LNLSKAKAVLIWAFLILNIFLIYQLWQDQGYGVFASFGQQEEIIRLELALENADLTMQTSLPKSTLPMAYMLVEPNENIMLNLDNNFRVKVNVDEERNVEEEALEIFEFIGSLSYLEGFIEDYTLHEEKGTSIFLRQEYEGFPLYTRQTYVFSPVDGEPLLISFFRLDILGFAEQEREIIPSSTALLRFLERYEGHERPMSIMEFSLGYYTQEYDAQRWEIPPVWRIRLNNGELYYINAFTGNPEQ